MLKIVLTGPESTGKSTLARQLAEHFNTLWVPEFSRDYLDGRGRPYRQEDLLTIAKGQVIVENAMIAKTESLLFLDTSLEVIKIWSEVRFGTCDPWIIEQLSKRLHDLYLLCRPDLPWEPDPLRENPNDRQVLYDIYKRELTSLNARFIEIHGLGKERLQNCIKAIEHFQSS